MSHTYDEIYGMDLDGYCKLQGVTVDGLIQKVEIDIEILKVRLNEEFTIDIKDPKYNSPISNTIYSLINKKQKHLNRLKEWKYEMDGIDYK